ncbi:MAG: Shikimate kinase 1 [Candidatus Aerophobetes bacterium ADurb.Bin490]|nr:MAG: Shikimate kinase 1 [Candidatus Aerophobetes bacterium ADurb.Bin490]HNZ29117.1 shikimate kinase [Candidatus Goldiibacteriota bacterium]
MKNIVLIGFMGSGKTSVGKKIAESACLKFTDVDAEIEKSSKMKIKDIFARRGESYFRALETAVLKKVAARSGAVISTGGGIIKMRRNFPILKKAGVVVYLKNSFAVSARRLEGKDDRPLFRKDNIKSARELYKSRLALYKEASDITVVTDKKNIDQAARLIIKKTENFFGTGKSKIKK